MRVDVLGDNKDDTTDVIVCLVWSGSRDIFRIIGWIILKTSRVGTPEVF